MEKYTVSIKSCSNLRNRSLFCLIAYISICCIIIYSPISRKRSMSYTSSLESCQLSVFHSKMGESWLVPFPTAQQVNLPASSPHCPFNAERQAGKLWIPILKSLV